jgi:hypothetical protein
MINNTYSECYENVQKGKSQKGIKDILCALRESWHIYFGNVTIILILDYMSLTFCSPLISSSAMTTICTYQSITNS